MSSCRCGFTSTATSMYGVVTNSRCLGLDHRVTEPRNKTVWPVRKNGPYPFHAEYVEHSFWTSCCTSPWQPSRPKVHQGHPSTPGSAGEVVRCCEGDIR